MFTLAVVIGFLFTFFGRKLISPIIFITGVILTMFIVILIFYSTFLKSNTSNWVGWVVLASSFLLGLLVGFILVKVEKLGGFILAGFGGYCLGLLIWNTFLYLLTTSAVLFWIFTIACALICGLLTFCLFDQIIILATAMAGSFVFIAGIGIVAGSYQNPFTID